MLQTKVVFLHRTLVEAEMDLFTEAEKELEQDEAETELEPAEVEKELEQDEAETEPLTWAMEAAEAEHKHHPVSPNMMLPTHKVFCTIQTSHPHYSCVLVHHVHVVRYS